MGRDYWLTVVPSTGKTKLHRLQENIGGKNVYLSDNELNKINAVLVTIKILGGRYPTQMQTKIGKQLSSPEKRGCSFKIKGYE